MSASIRAHTGYSACSHSKSVPSGTYARVAHWYMWSWALTSPGMATQFGSSTTSSASGAGPEPTCSIMLSRARSQPFSISSPFPVTSRPALTRRVIGRPLLTSPLAGRDRVSKGQVVGPDRHAIDRPPGGRSHRGRDGRARRDRRRLADTLQAVGRVRIAELEHVHPHRGHVEDGREQVVGE